MKTPENFILIVLEDEGFFTSKQLEQKLQSATGKKISSGSLSNTISRMMKKGWISLTEIGTEKVVKQYQITDSGKTHINNYLQTIRNIRSQATS